MPNGRWHQVMTSLPHPAMRGTVLYASGEHAWDAGLDPYTSCERDAASTDLRIPRWSWAGLQR